MKTLRIRDSLIENDSILVCQDADTWEEAVKLGTDRLVKSGALEEKYYEQIVKATNEMGPYYMLLPGIAMPHARPEDGVIKDCFGITILNKAVKFSDDEDEYAQILLTLAATSSDAHAEVAIPQIIELLEDEEIIDKLVAAKSVEEVLEIIG